MSLWRNKDSHRAIRRAAQAWSKDKKWNENIKMHSMRTGNEN
jgi:hypothetical protein